MPDENTDLLRLQPLDRYSEQQAVKISAGIQGKQIVYLDMKYWILLREQDKPGYRGDKVLLELVQHLIKQERCVFPVSDITYYETLKQDYQQSRDATFALMERFSGNICLQPSKKRIEMEFLDWLERVRDPSIAPLRDKMWTKLPLALTGGLLNGIAKITADEELQDDLFKRIADLPVNALVDEQYLAARPDRFRDDVDAFNRNKAAFEHENRTKAELFLSEVGGLLLECQPQMEQAMSRKHFNERGRFFTPEEIEKGTGARQWCNLIYHCFKNGKVGAALPHFRIGAAIYTSFRWNKGRVYTDGNDTTDVLHACAALPYCDYFFTENELRAIIDQEGLGKLYGCGVASKPADVAKLLNALV